MTATLFACRGSWLPLCSVRIIAFRLIVRRTGRAIRRFFTVFLLAALFAYRGSWSFFCIWTLGVRLVGCAFLLSSKELGDFSIQRIFARIAGVFALRNINSLSSLICCAHWVCQHFQSFHHFSVCFISNIDKFFFNNIPHIYIKCKAFIKSYIWIILSYTASNWGKKLTELFHKRLSKSAIILNLYETKFCIRQHHKLPDAEVWATIFHDPFNCWKFLILKISKFV